MRLERIPSAAPVFLDANIFIYHFTGVSPQCTALLVRCEDGEVQGVTGAHVLAEVAHRLMTIEAIRKGLVKTGNVSCKLQAHPEVVRRLTDYQPNLDALLVIGLRVLTLSADDLVATGPIRRTTGSSPTIPSVWPFWDENAFEHWPPRIVVSAESPICACTCRRTFPRCCNQVLELPIPSLALLRPVG